MKLTEDEKDYLRAVLVCHTVNLRSEKKTIQAAMQEKIAKVDEEIALVERIREKVREADGVSDEK